MAGGSMNIPMDMRMDETTMSVTKNGKNNINPIRVESSMSMIKRIVAPGSQVFKSTYPMGVMAAEETEDEAVFINTCRSII